MIDVEDHQRQRSAFMGRLIEQGGQVRFEIAAIVQAGQRIDDRHLDRRLHVVAQ